MRAKDFFERARSADRDIQRLESLRDHYTDLCGHITAKWGGSPGGGGNNTSTVETAAIGIFDAETGILEKLARFRAIVAEAEKVISKVPQDRFRQILTMHYLGGKSLAEISAILEYEDRNSIYRARSYALKEAQKVINMEGL